LVGGVMGALRASPFLGIIIRLGYPAYLMTILGVSYFLAGVAIVLPRFPRAKEWAYAGLIFIYSGAAVSRFIACDGIEGLLAPFIFSALVLTSWLCVQLLVMPLQRREGQFAPFLTPTDHEDINPVPLNHLRVRPNNGQHL